MLRNVYSSDIVQYVALYGVYYGHMASVLGRNVVFCYEQFSLSVDDVICVQLDLGCSRNEILSKYCAASLFEVLILRHGILAVHDDFTRTVIDDFIRNVCEDWTTGEDNVLF